MEDCLYQQEILYNSEDSNTDDSLKTCSSGWCWIQKQKKQQVEVYQHSILICWEPIRPVHQVKKTGNMLEQHSTSIYLCCWQWYFSFFGVQRTIQLTQNRIHHFRSGSADTEKLWLARGRTLTCMRAKGINRKDVSRNLTGVLLLFFFFFFFSFFFYFFYFFFLFFSFFFSFFFVIFFYTTHSSACW